jgi:hypothetical protein
LGRRHARAGGSHGSHMTATCQAHVPGPLTSLWAAPGNAYVHSLDCLDSWVSHMAATCPACFWDRSKCVRWFRQCICTRFGLLRASWRIVRSPCTQAEVLWKTKAMLARVGAGQACSENKTGSLVSMCVCLWVWVWCVWPMCKPSSHGRVYILGVGTTRAARQEFGRVPWWWPMVYVSPIRSEWAGLYPCRC